MALSALNVAIAVFIAQFGNHKCETIHTSTRNEFYGGMINCSSTEACTVICDQDMSCYDATIYCPSNYPCDIHCGTEFSFFSHSGACAQATFHCPTEASCSINCAANACSDTLVNCPTNANCDVMCEDSGACSDCAEIIPLNTKQIYANNMTIVITKLSQPYNY
eukprot:390648_1